MARQSGQRLTNKMLCEVSPRREWWTGAQLTAARTWPRIRWTPPRHSAGACSRGRGLGGCEGGAGEADREGPVEREGVLNGRAGRSRPHGTRAMRPARGVKQERCRGGPAVDAPGRRHERRPAAAEGVGGTHGLRRKPRAGERCGGRGAGAVRVASAPGVPGHPGGSASGPYRSSARSGRASPPGRAPPAAWTRAPRATGGTAPAVPGDDGDGAGRRDGGARSLRAGGGGGSGGCTPGRRAS